MAAFFPPSSPTRRWTYDVFLSFRGEDTRKTFTDHLYFALKDAGVNAFRDDNELRRGNDIGSELLKAIRESRISVVVFSVNYSGSRWCLEELTEILECRKRLRQLVLPIFYGVDPSDVRKQRGSFEFGEAFVNKLGADMEKLVSRWKSALSEAANLSGWDLSKTCNGHEAKFIKKIVAKILQELNHTYLNVANHPVGLDGRVRRMNQLLSLGSNDGTDSIEGLTLNLPRSSKVHLRAEAFEKMKNLRLLQLNHLSVTGDYKHLPKELVWLYWHGFPLKHIPKNFQQANLVVIDMQYSNLRQVWKDTKVKDCPNIRNLPRSVCKLKLVETLDLSGCLTIDQLPEDIGDMESLTRLIVDNTAIRQVPLNPTCTMKGFAMCMVYSANSDSVEAYPIIKVINKTKTLDWTYLPPFRPIEVSRDDHLWVSIAGDQLGAYGKRGHEDDDGSGMDQEGNNL
ncbi:disease resistance protein (TIR-NBS-LRR class) family [Actinidia rufa]|uniref:Disease resistance protein (TIR-NBS-LRR class) family n=1 Tax=Actinidia rufa TaxID=165716 RepID=A0A7J0E2E1_9ERIC|nr:disease resistance protein (TIR-NBS-LRR class) family [Actinidia rufa]